MTPRGRVEPSAPWRARLVDAWYAPRAGLLAALLTPLSWLFAGVVGARRALYRSGMLSTVRVGVPVVVVGNVTVGGAGKTPLVIALAGALAARGRKPGIVSRGYGGNTQGVAEVRAGDDPRAVGDEPPLLAATGHPVWIGRDRVAAAQALCAAHPICDVLLCDDGLQHYRLARDVEIAVLDASRGLGNGLLLPAGPLREPRSRLNGVDAIAALVSDRNQTVGAFEAMPSRPVFTMTHEPAGWRNLGEPSRVARPEEWVSGTVHAIAGIGHPQRFFDLLAALGIDVVAHAFPDHHRFVAEDLALPEATVILMTAKDAVKCASFADGRCFALDIRAVPDPALVDLVLQRIDGRQAA